MAAADVPAAPRRAFARRGRPWRLYDRGHTAGRAFAGREVLVGCDAASREWVVRDAAGQEVRRLPAREINRDDSAHLRIARAR